MRLAVVEQDNKEVAMQPSAASRTPVRNRPEVAVTPRVERFFALIMRVWSLPETGGSLGCADLIDRHISKSSTIVFGSRATHWLVPRRVR